jgi:thioredoxin-dependent peroxiredoxin
MLGEPVADFSLQGTGGNFRLKDGRGKKLVLYFYPKDNTPGCTQQGSDFRDAYKAFQRAGVEIYGVSRDSLKSHEGFKAKMKFPFELLSDPDEAVCKAFGVMKLKNMYGRKVRGIERSTFVIDEKGVLAREWRGVKVPGHVQEVLNFVKAL